MLIDIVAFLLLAMAIWKGIRKGLVVAVFSFLAFIIGLAAALKFSALAATYIGSAVSVSARWLPVLAFLLVFLLVMVFVHLCARLIEGMLKLVLLGWLNRLGGIIFYMLLYLVFYSIALFYATQLHVLKPATIESSVTYGLIQPMAPVIMDALGTVLPIFKNMFQQLMNYFQQVSGEAGAA